MLWHERAYNDDKALPRVVTGLAESKPVGRIS